MPRVVYRLFLVTKRNKLSLLTVCLEQLLGRYIRTYLDEIPLYRYYRLLNLSTVGALLDRDWNNSTPSRNRVKATAGAYTRAAK